jgi:hypothetical protein
VGYQPLPEGGSEYIVHIEPGTLQSLVPGEELKSYLPLDARDVHPSRIRVVISNEKPPQKLPAKPATPAGDTAKQVPTAGSSGPAASGPVVVPPPSGKPLAAPMPPFMSGGSKSSTTIPGPLLPDPNTRRIDSRPAGFDDAPHQAPKLETAPAASDISKPAEKEKPWLWLWLAILGLCASLSGNFYLGWIFSDARTQYRRLLDTSARPAPAG